MQVRASQDISFYGSVVASSVPETQNRYCVTRTNRNNNNNKKKGMINKREERKMSLPLFYFFFWVTERSDGGIAGA
jgi:hypothetical protein